MRLQVTDTFARTERADPYCQRFRCTTLSNGIGLGATAWGYSNGLAAVVTVCCDQQVCLLGVPISGTSRS
jgi:hypothetical protein